MIKTTDNLLEKLRRMLDGKREVKEKISNVIKEVVGIEIKERDISCKNNVIKINTRPLVKNEILFKKDLILGKLKEETNHIFSNIE